MQPRTEPVAEFRELFDAVVESHHQGRYGEAVERYRSLLARYPRVPEVYNNLGCALLALERISEAKQAFEQALACEPDYAEAWNNLGLLFADASEHRAALDCFERAAAIRVPSATIYGRIAQARLALAQPAEALNAYRRALDAAPEDAVLRHGVGVALDDLGCAAEAAAAFRLAIALDPRYAEAHSNLGKVLTDLGELGEARQCLERALELDPSNPRFHWQLARTAGTSGSDHVAQLETLSSNADHLAPIARAELSFALARAYEATGRYDEAFSQLQTGNRAKRTDLAYEFEGDLQAFDALEATFTAAFCSALSEYGHPSARPIFVFGMPRSGTTLVEQLLAAHPDVAGGGELLALRDAVRELWPAVEHDAHDLRPWRSMICRLGYRYLEKTDAAGGTARRLTDKMPANFTLAPLIALALPAAKMIHVRRSPLDTCVSCYATLFAGQSMPYTYDLRELGHYYARYERLMERWRNILPRTSFLEIEYEALVADFEAEARRLLDFCELGWNADVLAFNRARRAVRTASNVQVRQPLYSDSVGRADRFVRHLGPLIEELDAQRLLARSSAVTTP